MCVCLCLYYIVYTDFISVPLLWGPCVVFGWWSQLQRAVWVLRCGFVTAKVVVVVKVRVRGCRKTQLCVFVCVSVCVSADSLLIIFWISSHPFLFHSHSSLCFSLHTHACWRKFPLDLWLLELVCCMYLCVFLKVCVCMLTFTVR